MKFVHLLSRLTGTYWLITDEALENIAYLLETRLISGVALQPMAPADRISASTKNGIATIPIQGVIGKGLSPMEIACGGCDIDQLAEDYYAANSDPVVSEIHFKIASPGGMATGIPEFARAVYDSKTKPLIARSDTQIGSAAYYVAAAADEIVVTPTTDVGSIGVVAQIRETLDPKSVDGRTRLRVFRSGADKLMGSDAPLTAAQEAHMQGRAEFLGKMFRDFVAETRPGVGPESMTGLTYFGAEAVARGLADRVEQRFATAA